ncbi:MAG: D-alanyl-D-alanine carboxypeptidase [Desulfovibrionaceae bacterium]|nr:D-alanyl-D-alanine carboxypeptidase [Desulfovibrionaceae bacterium]MBF0514306.1 D-alanyl-D-alanine carboxypeptidase [Desulfovibrionaceae bacterium]
MTRRPIFPALAALICLGLAAALACCPEPLYAAKAKSRAVSATCPPYRSSGKIDWRNRKHHGRRAGNPRGFHVASRSAVLLDFSSGATLYAQDPERKIAPASITKVLTLYLLYEDVALGRARLTDYVPVSARARDTGGSSMGLDAGDKVTLGELIHGISIASANDGCVAVAEHSPGGVPAFVRRMNAKARELGMTGSVFKNPNGLPAPGQFSTARDIARLSSAYIHRFPQALAIHCQRSYTHDGHTGCNANSLLAAYPGADGLKTGYVDASGYNITATATRDGVRLIAVVLGCSSSRIRERETIKLLNKGFAMIASGKTGSEETPGAQQKPASKKHKKHRKKKSKAA